MEKEGCKNLFLTEVEEILVHPERHVSILVHERGGEHSFSKKNCLRHRAFFFFCNILFIIIKLHRMKRQKALSAFQSSRLIVPPNAVGNSECLFSLANTPSSCWRI